MPDTVSPEVRSRMMAAIGGKHTKPEMLLRRGLHAKGFRYRLHAEDVIGTPDIVFPRYDAVMLAHGCFWHGHDCPLFRWPSSRQEFWRTKIINNRERDQRITQSLLEAGWRVITVWECAMKGPGRMAPDTVIDRCASFLRSRKRTCEIRGNT